MPVSIPGHVAPSCIALSRIEQILDASLAAVIASSHYFWRSPEVVTSLSKLHSRRNQSSSSSPPAIVVPSKIFEVCSLVRTLTFLQTKTLDVQYYQNAMPAMLAYKK
jgi:hypothetical protein